MSGPTITVRCAGRRHEPARRPRVLVATGNGDGRWAPPWLFTAQGRTTSEVIADNAPSDPFAATTHPAEGMPRVRWVLTCPTCPESLTVGDEWKLFDAMAQFAADRDAPR